MRVGEVGWTVTHLHRNNQIRQAFNQKKKLPYCGCVDPRIMDECGARQLHDHQ